MKGNYRAAACCTARNTSFTAQAFNVTESLSIGNRRWVAELSEKKEMDCGSSPAGTGRQVFPRVQYRFVRCRLIITATWSPTALATIARSPCTSLQHPFFFFFLTITAPVVYFFSWAHCVGEEQRPSRTKRSKGINIVFALDLLALV